MDGSAISIIEDKMLVAWYTTANEKPMVNVIFSNGLDDDFSAPIRIDNGAPLGHLAIVLKKEKPMLSGWK